MTRCITIIPGQRDPTSDYWMIYANPDGRTGDGKSFPLSFFHVVNSVLLHTPSGQREGQVEPLSLLEQMRMYWPGPTP